MSSAPAWGIQSLTCNTSFLNASSSSCFTLKAYLSKPGKWEIMGTADLLSFRVLSQTALGPSKIVCQSLFSCVKFLWKRLYSVFSTAQKTKDSFSDGTSELDRNHVTTASTESQEAILHGSSTAEDVLDVTADSSSSSYPASCLDLSVLSLR